MVALGVGQSRFGLHKLDQSAQSGQLGPKGQNLRAFILEYENDGIGGHAPVLAAEAAASV